MSKEQRRPAPADAPKRETADPRLAFVMAARNGGVVEPLPQVPSDNVQLRNELEYFDPERWDGLS